MGMHMNIIESSPRFRTWLVAAMLGALVAGCGQDRIFGANGIAALVPAVTVVTPTPGATGVSTTNPQITATLNVPVAPITGTASMTVTCVTPCVNPTGVVTLDATHTIATFTLTSGTALASSTVYTATIAGATSLAAGVAMAAPFTWQFTTSADATVSLLSAAPFGTFGGSAGMTNSGILTVVNGDIGTTAVSTAVTGFHDSGAGCTYTEVLGADVGAVTGSIDTAPPPPTVSCTSEGTAATFAIATQALADARTAYNALVAMPGGPDPGAGNLANKVLVAGVYTAAAGSFMIQGGDLTLDARGDANAVFVFQMATTLTVGGPGATAPQSIILVNGTQAKNVFWQVGSAATINAAGGGTMVGTIISQAGAAFSTVGNTAIVTLDGRVLSLGASVTLVDTVINVPGP
jgi:Ice-binding-like/Bacterial Ig-like domain